MRRFAAEQIAARVERVEAEIARALESKDADTVHDLRVSIRRLRAALLLFRRLFRRGRVRRMRRILRERMLLAGEVRNRDIAVELIVQSGVSDGAGIVRKLEEERTRLAGLLHEALAEAPEMKLPKPSSSRGLRGSAWRENEDAAANAARILPRLARNFFRAGNRVQRRNPATPEQLHAFRLAAKRFRYSLEVFAPLFGVALQRKLDALKSIQTVLGDLNDLQTALTFEPVAASPAMAAWIETRRGELRSRFGADWEKLAAPATVDAWKRYFARYARMPDTATLDS